MVHPKNSSITQQQQCLHAKSAVIDSNILISRTMSTMSLSSLSGTTMNSENDSTFPFEHLVEQPLREIQRCHSNPDNSSMLGKIPYFLEQDIAEVITESPFLQQHYQKEERENIPLFHRSEVITGRRLGRGGFSDVYEIVGFRLDDRISQKLSPKQQHMREKASREAIDPTSGRGRYAIKHLQERLLTRSFRDFQFAASDLAIEIAYLSVLDHPNIMSVRGLPVDGIKAFLDGRYDSYFMICERLHDTLEDRINNWKLESEEGPDIMKKAHYAFQLAKSIEYLHQQRIIFRDLKPQNIGFSVENNDKVVLIDFGLVREIPNGCTKEFYEMSGVGTRRYMAPEIINDLRYNMKADVYSWSMVFWEMLTLTKPYPCHSIEEHKIAVCQRGERPYIFIREWPQSIQALLRLSWQDSVNRFDMKEVCEYLENVMNEQNSNIRIENVATPERQQPCDSQTGPSLIGMTNIIDFLLQDIEKPKKTLYEIIFGIPELTQATDSSSSSLYSPLTSVPLVSSKSTGHLLSSVQSFDGADKVDDFGTRSWNSLFDLSRTPQELTMFVDDGVEVLLTSCCFEPCRIKT